MYYLDLHHYERQGFFSTALLRFTDAEKARSREINIQQVAPGSLRYSPFLPFSKLKQIKLAALCTDYLCKKALKKYDT